jgi:hypothetical protein
MKKPHLGLALSAAFAFAFASWDLWQQPRSLVATGVQAYAAQDFEGALDSFEQALSEQSQLSTASIGALQRNLALTALRAGYLDRATTAADAQASSGHVQDLAWRDFFMGNVSWRRSVLAEIQAHGPVPPAGALERAIAHAEAAQQAWQNALESQSEWSAAQRNLERVAVRLAALREELVAGAGAADPDMESMAPPPEMTSAPLNPADQERLMQQLERLDVQLAKRKAEEQPEQGGYGW